MKKISNAILGILALFLLGCESSDTYRGSWKATDKKGAKFELFFDAKNMTIKDTLGEKVKFEYTQNSVNIENSVETYGIILSDGRGYQINFPNTENENIGFIKDENGSPIYTISRKNFINYDDVYKLK